MEESKVTSVLKDTRTLPRYPLHPRGEISDASPTFFLMTQGGSCATSLFTRAEEIGHALHLGE
jgi:hypothetical protein